MASAKTVRAAVATSLLVDGILAAAAVAQVPPSTPIAPSSPTTAPAGSGWIAAAILIVGLIVLIGVLVKLYDLRGKRETEAVHLQAQISDAMLREPNLFGLPIAATAHIPLWSGTPVRLELAGEVPDPGVREAVLRLAGAEAERIRPDVEIVDHLTVRQPARVA
jgi:hypothetical protein